MGKQKVEKSEFDLLDENVQQKQMGTTQEDKEEDVYNILGNLKIPYTTKKTKNGKINLQLNLQNKEQLNTVLTNVSKLQNALDSTEYIVIQIAQRTPYTLTLIITKANVVLKISYLSGYIKNTNMSIPVSVSTISSLQQIVNALSSTELGKKLLSISQIQSTQNNTENLL